MLEPLKERTRDTCETRIRGGPPEATGLSLVTQPGYSVSASTVFSFSYDPFKQKFWIVWILPGNFGRTLQIFSTSRAIKAVQMLLHRSKVIKCPYCTVPGEWCYSRLRPCSHFSNFCLFCKKLCQQEPVSSANDVFHLPKLLMSCHQTSKMPSRIFGGLQSFVRRQNPLFLASYPSWGHLISRTWPRNVASGYTKN